MSLRIFELTRVLRSLGSISSIALFVLNLLALITATQGRYESNYEKRWYNLALLIIAATAENGIIRNYNKLFILFFNKYSN